MIFVFLIILSVYVLINTTIILKSWQFFSLILPSSIKKIYVILMIFLSLQYVICMFLFRGNHSEFSKIFLTIGASWFVVLIYGVLVLLIIEFIRLIAKFVKPLNNFLLKNIKPITIFGGSLFIVFIAGVFIIGNHFATTPKVTSYKVDILKKNPDMSSIKIAFISDLHLGDLIDRDRLRTMIDNVNSINPDLVLLGGDILDGESAPFVNENMGEEFKRLNPKFGIYGILGNHEYYGTSVKENIKVLKETNINMLIDEKVLINNSFYLVGRNDKGGSVDRKLKRKTINELMEGIDNSKPIIVLDHQPIDLDAAAKNFVDMQLSGHTHNGQFWPISLITNKIYELDWGQKIKDKTNIIVSCGIGTWGPQVRLGSYSEIVEVNVNFTKN